MSTAPQDDEPEQWDCPYWPMGIAIEKAFHSLVEVLLQNGIPPDGYPATQSPDQMTAEMLRAAILHVADKERRSTLAMRLLLRLPEFVAAGRRVEAWLLQSSAISTSEHEDESNAFLFQMFSYGYDAWTADKLARDESLLRKLGVDPDRLRTMSLDEIDSWIRTQESNPARVGALETLFRENPHLREESVANIEALERNSTKLLARPDSQLLRLPVEETQSWLGLFNERASQDGYFSGTPDGAASDPFTPSRSSTCPADSPKESTRGNGLPGPLCWSAVAVRSGPARTAPASDPSSRPRVGHSRPAGCGCRWPGFPSDSNRAVGRPSSRGRRRCKCHCGDTNPKIPNWRET